ncbi:MULTISPECIES: DUF5343 domain-containing protein [unclassified Bradyrhizobium]|uniref:DUF5343 domain-containing protein n=1 Tax=unclassified Bradyrhizobium TaxID=2631580 RepID=UPI0029169622|nr:MULTISPECIES: DUF5343 domain-containing protein [unclassified Bradyrhizobium]
MPVTADKPAPYAPAAAIVDVVNRHRERGLPVPLNGEALGRIGVPDSLISRVLYALNVLDLIDVNGAPSPALEALRLAPEAEFKPRLEEWLRSAYADIFGIVDPAKDDETRIRDAFRNYQPVGQQSRMVTLFVGLCSYAGIILERQATSRSSGSRSSSGARPLSAPTRPRPVATTSRAVGGVLRGLVTLPHPKKAPTVNSGVLPPPLAGLLESLPDAADGWTKEERTKFLTTFEAVLDFCIPVVSNKAKNTEADADV